MKRLICALVFLGLASCGEGGEESPPRKVTSIKVQSAHVEKLRALSQQNRDLALRRAIQDSQQTCKRITGSTENGTYENMTIWNAYCEGEKDYAVFVGSNGDTQVRPCGDLAELGLPACKPAQAPAKQ